MFAHCLVGVCWGFFVGFLVFACWLIGVCSYFFVGLVVFAGVCLVVSLCFCVIVFGVCLLFVDGSFHFQQPLIIGQRCP